MTLIEKRDLFLQQFTEIRNLRPRTDQAHVALQDVDELRQLIQPELPDPAADASDSCVAVGCPPRLAPFGTMLHGAKLQNLEGASSQTDTRLPEEHGTSVFEQDRQSHHGHYWKGEHGQNERDNKVNRAFSCQQHP